MAPVKLRPNSWKLGRWVWHLLANEIAAFPVAALRRQLVAPLYCHQWIANLRLKDHEAACSDILLSLKGKAYFAVASIPVILSEYSD